MTLPRSLPGRSILAVRVIFGPVAWLAPGFTLSVLGMDPDDNPQALYWARLFAIRDLTLGLGVLASTGGARRTWWRLGMLSDVGDAAAGVVEWRRGHLPRSRAWLALYTGAATVGVSLGAGALLAGDD